MRKEVFLRVMEGAKAYNQYFQKLPDGTGRLGISALQKCTTAIRILAYGEAADRVDEYLRLNECIARLLLHHFTEAVIFQFGAEYMRNPIIEDLEQILRVNKKRGFSGTCNDLTVLYRYSVFDDFLNGRAPVVKYQINGHEYDTPYYLTDGIYPNWSAFVQSFPLPQTPKEKLFAKKQVDAKKDVERAFGVLQARFAVLRYPAMTWDTKMPQKIMKTCIILHNMIVDDERYTYASYDDPDEYDNEFEEGETSVQRSEHTMEYVNEIRQYIENQTHLEDNSINSSLRDNLVEHTWQKFEQHAPTEDE